MEGKRFILSHFQTNELYLNKVIEDNLTNLFILKYLQEIELEIILKKLIEMIKHGELKVDNQNFYPLLVKLYVISSIETNGHIDQGIKIILENRNKMGLLNSVINQELCNAFSSYILAQNGYNDELVKKTIIHLQKTLEKDNLDIISEYKILEILHLMNQEVDFLIEKILDKYQNFYNPENLKSDDKIDLFFMNYLLKLLFLKNKISKSKLENSNNIKNLVKFIILQRNLDCGWGTKKNQPSNLLLTILVLHNLIQTKSIILF